MRGKKGAQAANRQDRAELEQRAATAEHAAARLDGDLRELKERSSREIHTLRTALSEARKQRDEATSPTLSAAEGRIAALLKELRDERAKHKKTRSLYWKLYDALMLGSLAEGLTESEAVQRFSDLMGEEVQIVPRGAVKQMNSAETDEERQRAEGFARALIAKDRQKVGAARAHLGLRAGIRATSEDAPEPVETPEVHPDQTEIPAGGES